MRDLSAVSLLGTKITKNRKERKLFDQVMYIDEILERFGITDCNPVHTSLDANHHLIKEMSS